MTLQDMHRRIHFLTVWLMFPIAIWHGRCHNTWMTTFFASVVTECLGALHLCWFVLLWTLLIENCMQHWYQRILFTRDGLMASPLLQKNLIIINNGRFEDRVDQTSMRGLSWRDRRGRSEWWECKILRDIVLHEYDSVSFAWLLSLSSRFVVIVFLVFVLPRVFFLCTFSRKSLSLGGLKVLCA